LKLSAIAFNLDIPYGPGISRLKAMADHFNCLHKETSK